MIGVNGQDLGLFTPNLKLYQLNANTLSLENLAGGTYKNFKMGDLTLTGGVTALTFTAAATIVAAAGLTLPAFTLGGALTGGGQTLDNLGHVGIGASSTAQQSLYIYKIGVVNLPSFTMKGYDPSLILQRTDDSRDIGIKLRNAAESLLADLRISGESLILANGNATYVYTPRLTINGHVAMSVATWQSITHTGFVLTASEKIYPVSGVAGFSVVSTALTLGSAGSIIAPVNAGALTDAIAGNLDGAHGVDTTGAAERWYFRAGAAWRYISKTGGLSMTKEERIDPTGHEFKIGDEVKLIVDTIRPDGSFHALPYFVGG